MEEWTHFYRISEYEMSFVEAYTKEIWFKYHTKSVEKCGFCMKNKFQFITTNAVLKFPVLTTLNKEPDKVLMITGKKMSFDRDME